MQRKELTQLHIDHPLKKNKTLIVDITIHGERLSAFIPLTSGNSYLTILED